MSSGIYAYVDKKTKEIVYIGKDSYIDKNKRKNAHNKKSNYNAQKINKVLQNNPNRYQYIILKEGNISQNMLNILEISFIQKYNPKFNFTKGGDGIKGFKHSEETKNKISNSHKGKKLSLKHKEKISKSKKGQKIKRKNPVKGKAHPMFGKTHSKESIKKMSLSKKGKKLSNQTKIKISKKNNSTGYFRVTKVIDKTCKKNFRYVYQYYENKKHKKISSVDIKKLEKKVKEKGLIWKKITN